MNSEKQSTNLQMTSREVNRVGEGQKNIPKLRFKGYEDAWEQRKLGEEVQIVMGQSPKGENYTDNPEDYILVQGNADMKDGKVFPRVWTTQVTKQAYKGDIILSVRAPVGDIGKTDYDVVIGRGVAAVKGNEFFYQLLGKLKQDGYWTKSSTGSTFDSINSNEIKNAKVTIPDIKEQLFLGDYFQGIDNLITLHQRKYDALKTMKKTLLSKMFPKDGEDVPEIRFKEFTDAWEQRKLGNVAKYRNGKAHEQSVSENGKYVIVNSKFVSTNGEVQKFSCEQIAPLFKNEIAFVLSDVPNGRAIARTFLIPHDDKYTLNQRIAGITPNETTDCYFLHLLMNRNHYFLRFDDGVKQTNLSVNDVMGFSTYYPLYEEQQLCGQFFQKIDNLITLHQRKLDELKNMKKTLLQQMFV